MFACIFHCFSLQIGSAETKQKYQDYESAACLCIKLNADQGKQWYQTPFTVFLSLMCDECFL
jgi:hypothetical protein